MKPPKILSIKFILENFNIPITSDMYKKKQPYVERRLDKTVQGDN